jgi:hypothetical protein
MFMCGMYFRKGRQDSKVKPASEDISLTPPSGPHDHYLLSPHNANKNSKRGNFPIASKHHLQFYSLDKRNTPYNSTELIQNCDTYVSVCGA